MPEKYTPGSTVDAETARRITRAISDPGSVVKRERLDFADEYEPIAAWTQRAVLAVLGLTGGEPLPSGLDARPVLRYTIHCSHCGQPHRDGDYESVTSWRHADVLRLGYYTLYEDGWQVDLRHLDHDMGGRALVCAQCWQVGWCETCGDEVHAWQERVDEPTDQTMWHQACGAPEVTGDAGAVADV